MADPRRFNRLLFVGVKGLEEFKRGENQINLLYNAMQDCDEAVDSRKRANASISLDKSIPRADADMYLSQVRAFLGELVPYFLPETIEKAESAGQMILRDHTPEAIAEVKKILIAAKSVLAERARAREEAEARAARALRAAVEAEAAKDAAAAKAAKAEEDAKPKCGQRIGKAINDSCSISGGRRRTRQKKQRRQKKRRSTRRQ